jgi:hypothetical protein
LKKYTAYWHEYKRLGIWLRIALKSYYEYGIENENLDTIKSTAISARRFNSRDYRSYWQNTEKNLYVSFGYSQLSRRQQRGVTFIRGIHILAECLLKFLRPSLRKKRLNREYSGFE